MTKTMKRMTVAMGILLLSACGGAETNDTGPLTTQLSKVREAAQAGQDQCLANADCASDQRCQRFCGNGWCGGVCISDEPVPVQGDCQTDADCGADQACSVFCGNGWCASSCGNAPPAPTPTDACQGDADCAQGSACTTYCGNGWCAASCQAAQCSTAADCGPNAVCLEGHCSPQEQTGCASDSACAAGESCQTLCGNGQCFSRCVPEDADPTDACVQTCAIGACAPGYSCWSDGNDYLCNSCVAACHGAVPVDCEDAPSSCLTMTCAPGTHCETIALPGLEGGAAAACLADDADSCAAQCPVGACAPELSCWSDGQDYLCNGCVAACHGAVQVDCADEPTSCLTMSCAPGTHCETIALPGLEGGSAPACIADSAEECVARCPIGACAFGLSCWSDGADYLCNDCVAACHGAVETGC